MFGSIVQTVRAKRPVIHCITNYVTANDCANVLLACGASPVMADAPEEAAEITAGCDALVLNLGTLSQSRLAAMLAAGKQANAKGIPVVLDPVGVGASEFRRGAVRALLHDVRLTAVRGNCSEITAMTDPDLHRSGVDSARCDTDSAAASARRLAQMTGAVIAVSGAEDFVTDGKTAYCITNGHPVLRQITGAGCMLSALTGAFLAAKCSAESCAAAVCMTGLAGEIAAARMTSADGSASARSFFIDAVYNMTDEALKQSAKITKL